VTTQSVLIVEDDTTIAAFMEWALTSEGHRVVLAADADTALSAVATETPAVVLMDMNLPGLDGAEVFRLLRERQVDIPVIAVTADHRAAQVAERAGFTDTLLKPFDLEELLDIVARYTG
jgi:DNA-binding response OmpR family regulator